MAEEKEYVVIDKSYLDSLLDKLHDITGENNPPKSFPVEELWDAAKNVWVSGEGAGYCTIGHATELLSDFLTTKSL